jgi:hypothetical protein
VKKQLHVATSEEDAHLKVTAAR